MRAPLPRPGGAREATLRKPWADARLAAAAVRSTLLELLELGSLLHTCVRNGSYDEALELEAACARLAAAAPAAPLAAALAADGRAGVRAMLSQLLQRLRGPVTLPECLRAVGYLRRLGAFSEPELRLAFLRCRHAWLASCLAEQAAAPAAPAEAAKRLTDVHRVHLFDAVMQYRAIFADDTAAADAGAGAARDGGLLAAWAAGRVGGYLGALGAALGRVGEGAQLASVLEHAQYCGASLGRCGLDFRPLLPPMFERAVAALAARGFAAAADAFDAALATHRWAAPRASASAAAAAAAAAPAGDDDFAPPLSLVDALPAAALVNAVLAALNELRHAPLPQLRAQLAAALHDALAAAAASLARQGGAATRAAAGDDKTAAGVRALATALADVAAPYCASAFARVYPGAAPAVDAAGAMEPARALLLAASAASA